MIESLGSLNEVFQYLSGQNVWIGLTILGFSAILEYVVPPFPGDSITIAGAVLIPRAGWPVAGVFGALLLGTAVGASIDWYVGRWLAREQRGASWIARWMNRESVSTKLDALHEKFERWGSLYIVLNRFVPAFRALFFVAAGHAGLRWHKVLFFGCLGAALYNSVLLAVGYAVGYKLDALARLIETYSRYFFVALALALAAWGAMKIYQVWKG